jgi:8-oxo-dGTP diphosphatase
MDPAVRKIYGNRLRTRACGLCWDHDKLLLVSHNLGDSGTFWAPPGGGVEFGETLEKTIKREFLEETGLEVEVGDFSFGCEYIETPLHAIELFFQVNRMGGGLRQGYDPELQLIQSVKYFSIPEIQELPDDQKHGIFRVANRAKNLKLLSGFYSI